MKIFYYNKLNWRIQNLKNNIIDEEINSIEEY